MSNILEQYDALWGETQSAPKKDSYDPIPDGKYTAKIERAETKTSQAGKPTFSIGYVITGPKEAGRWTFQNFNLDNPIGLSMLKETLNKLGHCPEKLSALNPEIYLDTHCEILLKSKPGGAGKVYQNCFLNKVLATELEGEDNVTF